MVQWNQNKKNFQFSNNSWICWKLYVFFHNWEIYRKFHVFNRFLTSSPDWELWHFLWCNISCTVQRDNMDCQFVSSTCNTITWLVLSWVACFTCSPDLAFPMSCWCSSNVDVLFSRSLLVCSCYMPCWTTSGPGVWVKSGQIQGSGFEWTWLQRVGHCADLSFVSGM